MIKASAVAESPLNRERVAAIADDTGLEVDALGGAPGVRSARYSPEGGDAANRARLLAELAALGDGVSRRARFRTVIAVVWPDGVRAPLVVEGVCLGRIAESERGRGGLGNDSLFIPDAGPADGPADGAMTFAEMSFADKQAISHRSRAIAALIAALADQHSD
jgi:XTP/dITP diphosphohydrolase